MTEQLISQEPGIDGDGDGYRLTTVIRTPHGDVVRIIVRRRPHVDRSRSIAEVYDRDRLRWTHLHELEAITWHDRTVAMPDTPDGIIAALRGVASRLYTETGAILAPPPNALTVLTTTAGHPVAAYRDPADARHAAGLVNSHLGFTLLTPTTDVPVDPHPDSLDGRVGALTPAQTVGITTGKEARPK